MYVCMYIISICIVCMYVCYIYLYINVCMLYMTFAYVLHCDVLMCYASRTFFFFTL